MKKMFYLFMAILLIIGLSEYSSARGIKLPKNYKQTLPERAKMDVPMILQHDGYSCATTSLSMVMSYYNDELYDKDTVWKKSGSSIRDVTKRCGNDMYGLMRASKSFGFKKYKFVDHLTVDQVKYFIAQNIPVIVNIRNFFQESYHAVTVVGYDKKGFFINDPAHWREGTTYHIGYKTFKKHWYAHLCTPKRKKYYRSAFILFGAKRGKLYSGSITPKDINCFSSSANIKIVIDDAHKVKSTITYDDWQYVTKHEKLQGKMTDNEIEIKNKKYIFKGKLSNDIIKGSYTGTNGVKCSGTFEAR